MRVGQTPLIRYADPGDVAQAELVEAITFPFRAALLQNHGLITAGPTMQSAVDSAVELEEACKLLLLLGSRPSRLLTDEEAARVAAKSSSPWSA
jgi:ribulose-5-phosphate 4-epimerase/fuculose-1-phosphate aldolase